MEVETLFYAVKIYDVDQELDLLMVWNYKTPNKVKLSSSTTRRTFGVFDNWNIADSFIFQELWTCTSFGVAIALC